MEFELISSRDNKLVKSVKKLIASSKERNLTGLFVLEGFRLCRDAVLNGYTVETLIVSESFSEDLTEFEGYADRFVKLPDSLFCGLCDTVNPQGILCVVKIPETAGDIEKIEKGKYLLLENTADPSNLGAMARTAEALGINGIIVCKNGCDPFSPKAQRSGMGALLRLPILNAGDITDILKVLKEKGFKIFASVVSGNAVSLKDVNFPENSVVMIGNEANGLTKQAVELADSRITIKMSGRAESLNAAAAAAIIMWQMCESGDTK
jgi:TrmH family RNA methyltransferase